MIFIKKKQDFLHDVNGPFSHFQTSVEHKLRTDPCTTIFVVAVNV